MSLTLREIITETDILVPGSYTSANNSPWAQAVAWLNALNQEFFDVVKIPLTEKFVSVSGCKDYELTGSIKEKDIDKVIVGNLNYRSLNYEDVQPTQNWFIYDETSKLLTLSAAPSRSGQIGIFRYCKSPITTFTTGGVNNQMPDAPSEHHWIYVLGLAAYNAKANEEDEKAANYGGQYRNALATIAQSYQKEGAT